MNEEQKKCNHLWVRRRDGSWCPHCRLPRFGVGLSDEELYLLQQHSQSQAEQEQDQHWQDTLRGDEDDEWLYAMFETFESERNE